MAARNQAGNPVEQVTLHRAFVHVVPSGCCLESSFDAGTLQNLHTIPYLEDIREILAKCLKMDLCLDLAGWLSSIYTVEATLSVASTERHALA